jgi:hypothetical protein
MNVGRRATEYKDNTPNIWNGKHWYEFFGKDQNEYGDKGTIHKNGKKDVISFMVNENFISELRLKNSDNPLSVRYIIQKISISLN